MTPQDAQEYGPGSWLAGDARDAALLANVRPAGRTNPRPARRYNLVVVGAGTAGLVTAAGGHLTNETVFNLTERPRRLLVVGGGPCARRARLIRGRP
jgi:hypothetical protein